MSTNANLPVLIGTHRYTVDLGGFIHRPLSSLRQMRDFSREPSDATFDNQGVWKRTQGDFIQGAGQNYLDQEDEADRRRFRTSKGIDVWGRRQITLLPDVDTNTTFTSGAVTQGGMITAGDYIYAGAGGQINRYNGTSWTGCTGETGTQNATFAAIGGYVYAATSGTLIRATVSGTVFSTFGSLTPDVIGTGGGRLVAGEGAALYEIDNAGGKVGTADIYTHFDSTGFDWTRIVAAPNGIYCFGDDSARSSVYLLTVVDATGALAPPYPTLQMPDGEFIRDALFFGGVMVLATNLGVRLSQINGSGFLTAGPLIEIGDVQCLCTDGRDIWFGWSNFDGVSTGLGRLRPERFTDTLVPAYASDLMATAQGVVYGCASLDGKRHFMSLTGTTMSLRDQSDDKVASGTYYSGVVTYGTPELKAVHSIEGSWDALPAGGTVALDVLDGLGGSVLGGGVTNTTTSSTSERGELTSTYEGEEVEVLVTLSRATDTTVSPTLRRWTLRAMVLPYRTEEIILPILLKRDVSHLRNGRSISVAFDPLTEFEYLHGLMTGRSLVDVTIGDRTQEMLVDSIGIGPDVETVGVTGWLPDQDWMDAVWAVRLLTIEPTT